MPRKIRSDAWIGTIERRLGISGLFRNPNGRDTRSDKLLGNFRKSFRGK